MAHGKINGPLRKRRRGTQAAHAACRMPGSNFVSGAWQEAASSNVVAASELEHGKLRLVSSMVRGRSGVEASGGVRARAWQAAAGQQQAALRVVAASEHEHEHGKLRLASSKRRRARVTEDGGGVRAADRMLQLPSSKRCPALVTEDGGGVRAADRMLRLPSSKVRGRVCGSVAEAGGGVRAADCNLPLPSRRFMTPKVGRSWRY
ncbi:hypothetical protein PF004_g5228 [Phytophthora fragariae]|uniref:Uncharacterized protein n=1 Tax=Phytophthora fragariae TaxID=53985 RepID=A0A6G0PGE0_9STRA|nr:hypothetical protein PF004_g5228 [Phytophthora fragariae]